MSVESVRNWGELALRGGMVAMCGLFLMGFYNSQQDTQREVADIRVDVATVKAVQDAQMSLMNDFSLQMRDFGRKIDNLEDRIDDP